MTSGSAEPAVDDASTKSPLSDASPKVKRAILTFVGINVLAGLASTALLPVLLVKYPTLLLVLGADTRNVILTAGQLDFPVVLAVGTVRRTLGMLATYWLSALYGRTFLRWTEQRLPWLAPILRFLERMLDRFGVALLIVVPIYAMSGLAGVTARRLKQVIVPMTLGQVVFITVIYYFGDSVAASTNQLIAWLSDHLWESTAACLLFVTIGQVVSRRRKRLAREAEREDDLGA